MNKNKHIAKIALLGDIHFGYKARSPEFAIPGVRLADPAESEKLLKESFYQKLKEEDVDYVFIAGDLTSEGHPLEFKLCNEFLQQVISETGIEQDHLICCLGNHDVNWDVSKAPLTKNLIKDSKKEKDHPYITPTEDMYNEYQKVAANIATTFIKKNNYLIEGPEVFTGLIETKAFLIYQLNSSCLSSHRDEIRHGKLGPRQLKWFEEQLKEYENDNRWKIVLLHHHPKVDAFAEPYHDISSLEEGPELIDLCGRFKINMVCHGHRHQPKSTIYKIPDWDQYLSFICTGGFAANLSDREGYPSTFHVIELHIENNEKYAILRNYQYLRSGGWQVVYKEQENIPIDGEVLLYKSLEPSFLKEILSETVKWRFNKQAFQIPEWKSLPKELRTLSYNKLTEFIKSEYQNCYDISGKMPEKMNGLIKE